MVLTVSDQLEAFITEATETEPAGIGILLHGASIVEDPPDSNNLVPCCKLTRSQALQLAYGLGELAQKLPED